MWHRQFESMGTLWQVTIDEDQVSEKLEQEIYRLTDDFDQQFSRFIETSEANKFKNETAGTHTVSAVFAELLDFAQQLKKETNGKFDPAIGSLLEAAGYDQEYTFKPNQEKVTSWKIPNWEIKNQKLTIDGPIVFDIGGYGKGYWIDQLSNLLTKSGHQHYLVDGGGDMFGTTKQGNKPWRIAIEKPGEPESAISIVELNNQALAISDIFKRTWEDWHHTVDPDKKISSSKLAGCAVLAPTAMVADALTTCLALINDNQVSNLVSKYAAEYVMVTSEKKLLLSSNWPGQLL